jgi:anion-transporting  ArsA/GET3 family ATPase
MLDAKRTFDDLVARFAPSLDAAERILSNRLYQFVSGRLAGSQEYMALEKLYEIATANEYDLIVVDTPPTQRTIFFESSTASSRSVMTPPPRRAPRPGGGGAAGRARRRARTAA